ncbi:helix-turn-helix transcriptional regulator [Methylocella sp.]|uniref:helix-turn-helix transcriptional regulator n=1 Tax=Methylocella sp. TaxID=1978226 RepID=UPI0037840657
MAQWDFESVLESVKATSFDPSLWPRALDALSRSVGGAGAVIYSRRALPTRRLASPDLVDVIEDYEKGGWRAHDLRARAVPIARRAGAVVDQDFASADEMRRSPFYEEFLARHNRRWFVGLPLEGGWGVSIHRSPAQGPFLPEEVARLRRLSPAFSEAVSLARRLGFARVEGLVQAMELMGRPCVALDGGGRPLLANEAGEAQLALWLDVASRRLAFADGASQAAFDAAVAAALGDPPASRLVFVRERGGDRRALRVEPLNDVTRFPFADAGALVIFERPRPSEEEELEGLKKTFGLTRSEARLARELETGRPLLDAARAAGLTYETARSYLKAIFLKTGTRRQAELAALLARRPQAD